MYVCKRLGLETFSPLFLSSSFILSPFFLPSFFPLSMMLQVGTGLSLLRNLRSFGCEKVAVIIALEKQRVEEEEEETKKRMHKCCTSV
ncbi:hypothetical protein V6Z12_D11G113300 [Gossypium hirsutum]